MGPNQPLQSTEQVQRPLNQPEKRKSPAKAVLITLLAFAVLAGAATGGYLWHAQVNDYKQKQAAADQELAVLKDKLSKLEAANTGDTAGATKVYKTNKYSFNVPDGWTVTDTTDKASADEPTKPQSLVVADSKSDLKVKYYLGSGGLGGGCDEVEQVDQILVSSKAFAGATFAKPSNYVEKYAKTSAGKYIVWFGLSSDAAALQGVCPNTAYMVNEVGSDGILFFGGGLTSYDQEFSSEAAAKQFFTTTQYAAAKKMILSMK